MSELDWLIGNIPVIKRPIRVSTFGIEIFSDRLRRRGAQVVTKKKHKVGGISG